MIGTIFYWILNMTIVGSLVGLLLLAIRLLRKLPRNFIYGLYSLLLIRLLCPFGFINGFSFLNLLPRGMMLQVNPFTGETGRQNHEFVFTNMLQSAKSYQPMHQKSDGLALAYEIGGIVWLVVGIVLFSGYLFMYLQAKRELKKKVWLRDDIYQCEAVSSPITVGILRPVIILPLELETDSDSLNYVIAHERTHIRKKDNFFRMLGIVLTCIYWFNPLIWFLQKCFFADMELACDESTIRKFDLRERKSYAQALLTMSSRKSMRYATGFTGGSVKVRIKRVISYRQITLWSGICLLGLFLLCAVCLLSNQ